MTKLHPILRTDVMLLHIFRRAGLKSTVVSVRYNTCMPTKKGCGYAGVYVEIRYGILSNLKVGIKCYIYVSSILPSGGNLELSLILIQHMHNLLDVLPRLTGYVIPSYL